MHTHSHTHSHSTSCSHSEHHHSHIPQDRRILLFSFALISLFMLVEFVGGYLFNSLALMADAGHMANDSLSLGLAVLALWIADKKPKLSQWLAVLNGGSLLVIAGYIIWEAVERLQTPQPMQALPMIWVATLGLVVNLIVARLMLKADHDNLNVRSAYLHVMADLLGSVVAIISGLAAYWLNWQWVDPVASLLLSLVILRSGWQVTQNAIKSLKS
ncbi:cation transporter [Actinobacillus indolicus]|uniref:Cation transporter n=1 Tax=Actinobacillus indolicus TaxID=51049 RepID=A0A4P7CJZ6_9PAST|nr:cation diffusion facilitator family transporter [Actinobacillus indolicus]QBQ64314.1 cation transporter [Actinobacillus indolicus]